MKRDDSPPGGGPRPEGLAGRQPLAESDRDRDPNRHPLAVAPGPGPLWRPVRPRQVYYLGPSPEAKHRASEKAAWATSEVSSKLNLATLEYPTVRSGRLGATQMPQCAMPPMTQTRA